MRNFVAIILVVGVSSPLLAQEAKVDWNFKASSARSAVKKYQAIQKKSREAFGKENKKNRLEFILALEKELQAATKRGDLKEAVKIQNAITTMHEGKEPASTARQFRKKLANKAIIPDGVYHADFGNNPWTHEYHVKGNKITWARERNDDGEVKQLGVAGVIRQISPDTARITWENGYVSRWTVAGSRIFVEWWGHEPKKRENAPSVAVIHINE